MAVSQTSIGRHIILESYDAIPSFDWIQKRLEQAVKEFKQQNSCDNEIFIMGDPDNDGDDFDAVKLFNKEQLDPESRNRVEDLLHD